MVRTSSRRPRGAAGRSLALGAALVAGITCAGGGDGGVADSETAGAIEDDFPDVEPGPLCGGAGPVKLLDLAADEALIATRGLTRIGERYFLTTGRGTIGAGASSGWNLRPYDGWDETTTYSVGRCGEAPTVVARGLREPPFALPRWPDAAVICSDDDLVMLPATESEARTGLIAGACGFWTSFTVVDDGVVVDAAVNDAGYRAHTFYRYAATDTPGFLPGVEIVECGRPSVILGDELVYVSCEDWMVDARLVRVGLADLAETALATGVGEPFAVSANYLLYYVDDVGVILRDRADDSEVVVFGMFAADWYMEPLELDAVNAVIRDFYGGGARLIDLASGQHMDVPAGQEIYEGVADGRRFVLGGGHGLLLDVAAGVVTDLGPVDGEVIEVAGDELLLRRDGGEVVVIPYSGGGEALVARRAIPDFVRLADGRIVTPVDAGVDLRGDLVVVDRATLREHRIDGSVFAFSAGQAVDGALDPGLVAYQVQDGARDGVYLINLAAP